MYFVRLLYYIVCTIIHFSGRAAPSCSNQVARVQAAGLSALRHPTAYKQFNVPFKLITTHLYFFLFQQRQLIDYIYYTNVTVSVSIMTSDHSDLPATANAAPYSRQGTIAALRSFYDFLATLPRLSADAIIDAPPSGWPALTDDLLAKLGPKTAAVHDLLRHVPIITAGPNDDGGGEGNALIAPATMTIRWDNGDGFLGRALGRGIIDGVLSPHGVGDELPPHVAVLSKGGRDGSWLLVDVEAGTVTYFAMMGAPEEHLEGSSSNSTAGWRAFCTRPIAEFFDGWVSRYRSLDWVVVPGSVEDGVLFYRDAATEVRIFFFDFFTFILNHLPVTHFCAIT